MLDYITVPEQPMFSNFDSWRTHQREAVASIINAKDRFIAVVALTGAGKSLIAMAVAKLLQGRTYYLVSTKDLQNQILKDFPGTILLKGRNNFECLIKKSATCDQCMYLHLEKETCPKKSKCPYYVQKERAKDAQIVAWNYSMFLTNQRFARDFPKVEMLICDEAHLLEGELMRFVDITFKYRFFDDLDLLFPGREDHDYIFTVLEKALIIIKKKYDAAKKVIREKVDNDGVPGVEDLRLCNKWENQLKKMLFFKSVYNPDQWVLDYSKDSKRWGSYISFKPIKVDNFSNYLFNWADKILLMSATLPHLSVLCNSLGIPQESIKYLAIPSTFRKENRPIIFIPIGRMSRSYLEGNLEKTISFLTAYCKRYKKKILVHCTNYKIANAMRSASSLFGDYQVFYHKNAKERSDALDDFKRADPPAILITPSMETGIDLAGDLCRVQFILKVPYLSIGDRQVKKRMAVDHDWFISCTIARLVQSAGRIVRSKNDWGVTYILDICFEDLIQRYRRFFPQWFMESVYRVPVPARFVDQTSEDWLAMLNGGKFEKM